jgi:hypothetical protein
MLAAVQSQIDGVQRLRHCRPLGAPRGLANSQSQLRILSSTVFGCTHNFILLASGVGSWLLVVELKLVGCPKMRPECALLSGSPGTKCERRRRRRRAVIGRAPPRLPKSSDDKSSKSVAAHLQRTSSPCPP